MTENWLLYDHVIFHLFTDKRNMYNQLCFMFKIVCDLESQLPNNEIQLCECKYFFLLHILSVKVRSSLFEKTFGDFTLIHIYVK